MGGQVTDISEWLNLTPEQVRMIEIRTRLGILLRQTREDLGLTQKEAAKMLGTGQARVSKMEAGDGTTDAQLRSLLACGAPVSKISDTIAGKRTRVKKTKAHPRVAQETETRPEPV